MSDKRFRRDWISVGDLNEAMAFIDCARAIDPLRLEYKALLFAAVVLYARPFSRNEKDDASGTAVRVSIDVTEFLNAERLALHETIVALRNRAIAHAESEHYPVAAPTPVEISPRARGFITTSKRFDVTAVGIDLDAFRDLMARVQGACLTAVTVHGRHHVDVAGGGAEE